MEYTFKSITTASKREVIEEIDGQHSQAERAGGLDKPHHLARAQLLFQELSSRSMLRHTRALTWLTVAIVVLTVALLSHDWSVRK